MVIRNRRSGVPNLQFGSIFHTRKLRHLCQTVSSALRNGHMLNKFTNA
ncbi:Uncharacterized protein dnm_010280 [Desulfonema magnum]|uniref:Uncharacterized protein n=1 Tax=Desulfonema magnum TaxID=45655 RepID=A0A975BFY4_9BACT|nr:Uncharacterized protein dnm_010280 [Desulfonema magnum]